MRNGAQQQSTFEFKTGSYKIKCVMPAFCFCMKRFPTQSFECGQVHRETLCVILCVPTSCYVTTQQLRWRQEIQNYWQNV